MPSADAASLHEYQLRMRFSKADAAYTAENGGTGEAAFSAFWAIHAAMYD